jgi:HD superfamily phosphodiesterase
MSDFIPKIYPDAAERRRLFQLCQTPDAVIAHGAAVARCAADLAQQLSCPVDTDLLTAACLLHDLTRGNPDHAHSGAQVLEQAGYPSLAALVAVHHDLPEDACPEACLLYLADKLVRGEQRVSLDERFGASREKCRTPEALASWQRRYDRARQIIQAFQLSLPD